MKATILKKDKRFEVRNDTSLGIQQYGEGNDYPQQVLELVGASGTGGACVDIYAKFISGQGFADQSLYDIVINRFGQTSDYLLDQIAKDYAQLGGLAIHVNYNANYQIVEQQHVPVETVRFEKLDESGRFSKYCTHPDWGRRFTRLRKWKKEDIKVFDKFNPDPVEIQRQVEEAGGWENYKGQIYYFSNQGTDQYPTPIFDSVLTDMSTEEGISNVNYRNVRSNFLAAGMLIDIVGVDDTEDQENETEKALMEFQGDEAVGKIMHIQVANKEESPEFKPFKGENYDKEFTVTRETVQNNIGKRFNQPPILRCEDVGNNFGAEAINNAYDYYNSITANERLALERVFSELFALSIIPTSGDYSIIPLAYTSENLAEKLGPESVATILTIMADPAMSTEQKKSMLRLLYNLSDEEINSIIPQ